MLVFVFVFAWTPPAVLREAGAISISDLADVESSCRDGRGDKNDATTSQRSLMTVGLGGLCSYAFQT